MLLLIAGAGYQLWIDHADNRAQERDRLQTQAHVIEENLVRQLQGANSALAGVRYDLLYGDHEFDDKDMQLRLRVLTDAMPGVRALLVLDKTGYVVASNRRDLVSKNFAKRAYFSVPLAEHDYPALYVSPPFMGSTGIFVLGLSKAMEGPNNEPAGVVTAILDPEYFDIVMRSVLYSPDMAVSITHGNGRVFLVSPANANALDLNMDVEGSFFRQHMQSGQAASVAISNSIMHKDERMIAIRNIQPADLRMNKPLTITVTRNLAAIDAPWRAQARTYAGVVGVMIVGACLAMGYVHGRRRAVKQANDATQRTLLETSQRFEFGLRGADLGLWDWNLAQDTLTINERQWRLLGYAPNEVELNTVFWKSLLHPDDQAEVQAALQAHIKGETPGYKLEHRVRHKDGHWLWVLDHAMVIERNAQGGAVRILGTHLDITKRKRADAELASATTLLRRTGEIAKIGGWQIDLNTKQQTWTAEVFRIHGLPVGEPPPLEVTLGHYAPHARTALLAAIQEAQDSGSPWALELEMTTARGQQIWVRSRGEPAWENGHAVRLTGILQDITERMQFQLELQEANKQLAQLTVTDGLTGVGNRRHFDQTLAAEWARSMRQHQALALLMIDIDHFKLYNDHYGHLGGDTCLREVARVLSIGLRRPGEMLMRYGGEEFAILLLDTDTAGASVLAQRCLDQIRQAALPHAASPVSTHVSLSIGIASTIPKAAQRPEYLVEQADAALYQAKHLGRARYACAPYSEKTEPV